MFPRSNPLGHILVQIRLIQPPQLPALASRRRLIFPDGAWRQLGLLRRRQAFGVHLLRELQHLVDSRLSVVLPELQRLCQRHLRRQLRQQQRQHVHVLKGLVDALPGRRRDGVRGVAHDDDAIGRARPLVQLGDAVEGPDAHVLDGRALERRLHNVRPVILVLAQHVQQSLSQPALSRSGNRRCAPIRRSEPSISCGTMREAPGLAMTVAGRGKLSGMRRRERGQMQLMAVKPE
ncbi:hypothetical protein VTN96DRAFT_3603 [Rasamsonia emersonii]